MFDSVDVVERVVEILLNDPGILADTLLLFRARGVLPEGVLAILIS